MTCCVGVLPNDGEIIGSDARKSAGLENITRFCEMRVFGRPGDRVIVMLSFGDPAGAQTATGLLNHRCTADDETANLWNVKTMYDTARLISDAMRGIDHRDSPYLKNNLAGFNVSFILGGQIGTEPRGPS